VTVRDEPVCAQPVEQLVVVGGDHHSRAGRRRLGQRVGYGPPGVRVLPDSGLVEQQDLRVVGEGGREA
jgi:hypothetical protein